MRKIIGGIIGLLGVALIIISFFIWLNLSVEGNKTAIIGGADKPTALFVLSNTPFLFCFITGIVFIIISAIMLLRKKH